MRSFHRGECGVAVGDVQLQGKHGFAEPLHQVVEGGCVAGGRRNVVAATQGCARELLAEAAACTGNAHGEPLEIVTISIPYAEYRHTVNWIS